MKTPAEKAVIVVDWAQKVKGLRQYQIEDRCNIPRGSLTKWSKNNNLRELSAMNVGKILMGFPEISADWMMRDDEKYSMLKSAQVHSTVEQNGDLEETKAEMGKLIDENNELHKRLQVAMSYSGMLQKMLHLGSDDVK